MYFVLGVVINIKNRQSLVVVAGGGPKNVTLVLQNIDDITQERNEYNERNEVTDWPPVIAKERLYRDPHGMNQIGA